jgi:hypothetical protein
MQPKHLYEYAIVRVVPIVEREEFVNAGVILFCKRQRYVRMQYQLQEEKILALMPNADLDEIRKNLEAFFKISGGAKDAGPIALLDPTDRFRWLTAVRSASIQTSRPHPGICEDLDKAFDKLFLEMVG